MASTTQKTTRRKSGNLFQPVLKSGKSEGKSKGKGKGKGKSKGGVTVNDKTARALARAGLIRDVPGFPKIPKVSGPLDKIYKQSGTSNRKKDLARRALPPGWRESKDGNRYFENRRNRSDKGDGGL